MTAPRPAPDPETIRKMVADGMTAAEIGAAFNLSRKSVFGMVARHQLGPWVHGKTFNRTVAMPADFAAQWAVMSQQSLAEHYRCSTGTIQRWCKALGLKRSCGSRVAVKPETVKPLKSIGNRYQTAPLDRPHRDGSRAGQAVEFLRRFGAVWRCNARGGPDAKGSHWRRGSSILTDADVVERAEFLGWDADAWKRCA